MTYPRIDDEEDFEDISKALGQFGITVGGVLSPLTKYGQGDYVAMAVIEIVSLAYQLYLRLSGVDEPYRLSEHMDFMLKEK